MPLPPTSSTGASWAVAPRSAGPVSQPRRRSTWRCAARRRIVGTRHQHPAPHHAPRHAADSSYTVALFPLLEVRRCSASPCSPVALPCCSARSLEAQQPSAPTRPADQAVFRLSVSLVQLDAVVTDKKGRHVSTLGRDDFEVYQDGRPQPIVAVSYVDSRRWLGRHVGPAAPASRGAQARRRAPRDCRRRRRPADVLRKHLLRAARHRPVLRPPVSTRRPWHAGHDQRRGGQPAHVQPQDPEGREQPAALLVVERASGQRPGADRRRDWFRWRRGQLPRTHVCRKRDPPDR